MANVVVLLDADADRLAHTGASLRSRLALFPGQTVRTWDVPGGWIGAAVAPGLPLSVAADGRGCALVAGLPVGNGRARPWTAEALLATHAAPAPPPRWDGLHGWARVDPDGRVHVGADWLGLFPWLLWSGDGVRAAATDLSLLRALPGYQARPDLVALARLALHGGIPGPRTVDEGTRRLPLLTVASAPRGGGWTLDRCTWRSVEPGGGDDAAIATSLDGFLAASLADDPAPAMLLSGGTDSRLLAARLAAAGKRMRAVTWGLRRDLEGVVARAVASELGWTHALREPPLAGLDEVERCVVREGLGAGLFALATGWAAARALDGLRGSLVSGLCLDCLLDGPRRLDDAGRPMTDAAFDAASLRSEGVSDVAALGGAAWREALGEAAREAREGYPEAWPEGDWRRTWWMELALRQHALVGRSAFRWAQFAWPVLPALCEAVGRQIASRPLGEVYGQKVKRALLAQAPVGLRRLPFDANRFRLAWWERPPWWGRLAWDVRGGAGVALHRMGVETRWFHRRDPRGMPVWRDLERALPARFDALPPPFDPAAFRRVWAGPPRGHAGNSPAHRVAPHLVVAALAWCRWEGA